MMKDNQVRVLVVDDLEDHAHTMAMMLRANGYVVEACTTGADALARMESFDPHCVLLDVHMPGIDGQTLSRRVRDRYGSDVVLIAVTGRAAEEAAPTFEIVDHYLMKPIDSAELAKVLPPVSPR
jgi:CheY-like chemotaxis protein